MIGLKSKIKSKKVLLFLFLKEAKKGKTKRSEAKKKLLATKLLIERYVFRLENLLNIVEKVIGIN